MALANRFSENVFAFWCDWYTDLIDFKNDANILHHIISPSSNRYVPGKHNQSIINACPLNNNRNHLHKSMHIDEKEDMLLSRVIAVLKDKEYRLNKQDKDFIDMYKIKW